MKTSPDSRVGLADHSNCVVRYDLRKQHARNDRPFIDADCHRIDHEGDGPWMGSVRHILLDLGNSSRQ